MAEIMQFKTESKRLLELMINSIYTNKEIFLRELISNASDAIDKYHFLSLTDNKLPKKSDYEIWLEINKENRTFTIKDNGIGMTYQELIDSLGTIAKSGSLEFVEKLKANSSKKKRKNNQKEKDSNDDAKELEDLNIIGQFGVGFYSAFMVANLIEVRTRSLYDEKGYMFKSTGEETYEISEITKEENGTEITLYLRPNNDEYEYDNFTDEWTIKNLVKQYSDYVRYPIKMEVTNSVPKKDGKENEYEEVKEIETLNSMTPIWKKPKNEISDADYNEFYKQKYYDYKDPFENMLIKVEGKLEYTALIYIPSNPPHNLYSEKYEKGLQLYCKGVFIMDKCKELIPDYLRFVKGLIDSNDLDLNISREILQQSKVLKDIADNVEKKILNKLETLMKNEYERYLEFYKNFGLHLKFGIYENYGLKKDLLKDLILYQTINNEQMISLKQYVDEMQEKQEFIYFASGKTKEAVLAMPQLDMIKKQNYNVLILSDDVDEFVINVLQEYAGKKFKSINQGDLDLLDEKEKEKIKELNETKKPILEAIKETLKDEVSNVILSKRLTDSAVCLVSSDGVSFEMEKVLSAIPNNENVKAERILEINPNHSIFKALEKVYLETPLEIGIFADLLYSQALLMEGFPIKDPVDFSKKMCDLMLRAIK